MPSSVQPKSCSGTPESRATSRLAIHDGTLRETKHRGDPCASRRPRRSPPRAGSSRRGMSAGSFCRSPSMGTRISPRAWSSAAVNAAVCPQLRRSRITRTCSGSLRWITSSLAGRTVRRAVVDEDQLVVQPSGRSTASSSAWSGSTLSTSLNTGIKTDRSIEFVISFSRGLRRPRWIRWPARCVPGPSASPRPCRRRRLFPAGNRDRSLSARGANACPNLGLETPRDRRIERARSEV